MPAQLRTQEFICYAYWLPLACLVASLMPIVVSTPTQATPVVQMRSKRFCMLLCLTALNPQ
jgi:hypothetical protein